MGDGWGQRERRLGGGLEFRVESLIKGYFVTGVQIMLEAIVSYSQHRNF